MMTGSAAFAAIPICRELRYTIFSSVVTVSINLLVILQEDAGNVFLQQADTSYLTQIGHCTSKLFKLDKQTGSDL